MKIKESRKVIGTFSQVENFVRSLPQLLYNHIENPLNEYWQWLLFIRKFVRLMLMSQITESQLQEMEKTIGIVLNIRMNLTRIDHSLVIFVLEFQNEIFLIFS